MGAATYYESRVKGTNERQVYRAMSKAQVLQHIALNTHEVMIASRNALADLLPLGKPLIDLTKAPAQNVSIDPEKQATPSGTVGPV